MYTAFGITKGQIFEVAFWGLFAVIAFIMTFGFDQNIESYKFGAALWPRAIIVVIFSSVCFQLYHDIREHRANPVGKMQQEENEEGTQRAWVQIIATLALPLVYASLLESFGFYVMTPFFLALYLYIGGERRWKRLIGVSLFIYVLLLIFFTKLLYVGLPTGTVSPFYEISNWLLVYIR